MKSSLFFNNLKKIFPLYSKGVRLSLHVNITITFFPTLSSVPPRGKRLSGELELFGNGVGEEKDSGDDRKMDSIGVPGVAQQVTNPSSSIHEDVDSIPGLIHWVKDLELL